MTPIKQHKGLAVPLMMANIDTDAIMPKQFLKSIKRTGYGDFIFDHWRYEDEGSPGMDCSKRPKIKDFALNLPRYYGASILVTGDNFGCGSSREHAPWGLKEFGFKVIIAPSFADIFYNNCTKNGLLPIRLASEEVDKLAEFIEKHEGAQIEVDLQAQTVTADKQYTFDIEPGIKTRLLEGLDDIAVTLKDEQLIRAFETQYIESHPWLRSQS